MANSTRISKLLIANRGEIACRVIRSARRLGIETVAVYSEADAAAMHVDMAHEAHCIGPAAAQQSYLNAARILDTAKASGSQAIHPGYGFLSENVEFAQRCAQEGVIFVGPPASAIRDMGIKNTSKIIMHEAGVPIIEGYHGEDQSPERLFEESRKIGFPVMIKAVRGGGGKGMRIALTEKDFMEQLDSAKREAKKAFDDDAMLIEKFIERPRHVEVQVFGDQHGNYVYLFERDCSVQRRHQKIIEEAPAPGLSEETRRELGEAAVRAARAVSYVGAGTVEFVMDKDQQFYFMEMNTRLQVEHPITEMITGVDLVEWQLRVASGEPLPRSQAELRPNGHAFEARIYAEDSELGFMPTAGRLHHLSGPLSGGPSVRVDTGVRAGDSISVHYDPMISKLIVHSYDRSSALQRLLAALADYHVAGLPTNVSFLSALAKHPAFQAGQVHTGFIEEHRAQLLPEDGAKKVVPPEAAMRGAIALCLLEASAAASPFCAALGFRVNSRLTRHIRFEEGLAVEVTYEGGSNFSARCGSAQLGASARLLPQPASSASASDRLVLELREAPSGALRRFSVIPPGGEASRELHLLSPSGEHHVLRRQPQSFEAKMAAGAGGGTAAAGAAVAPMPGVIEKVLVSPGQDVEAGQALVTMIAMKMEYSIRAGKRGRVAEVRFSEGASVKKGELVVAMEASPEQEELD